VAVAAVCRARRHGASSSAPRWRARSCATPMRRDMRDYHRYARTRGAVRRQQGQQQGGRGRDMKLAVPRAVVVTVQVSRLGETVSGIARRVAIRSTSSLGCLGARIHLRRRCKGYRSIFSRQEACSKRRLGEQLLTCFAPSKASRRRRRLL
jgi:hypothetical protein